MIDLGTLGGNYSYASDVNDTGQVVGYSTTASGSYDPFSWTKTSGMVDLSTSGGYASAVNESGQVVGYTYIGGHQHAVLWNPLAQDTTPPVITVPANITVNATGPAGAVVAFTVTATDENPTNPTVTCTPASGSVFPIGTTSVYCAATDAAGNTGTGQFNVRVRGAAEQLASLHDAVVGIGPDTSLVDKISDAQTALARNNVTATRSILDAFINQVKAQFGKTISQNTATALITDATRIKVVLGSK